LSQDLKVLLFRLSNKFKVSYEDSELRRGLERGGS
jgi:hypothetical protein